MINRERPYLRYYLRLERSGRLKNKKTMAPSQEDGTSAADEQLGSLSLGESVERKEDDDTEPNAKNGTPTKKCSYCGKESDTVKKCTACKCVWYCNKDCQKKHRKEHRKECKRVKKILDERGGKLNLGTEMDVGPLEKLPPRDECPLCMRVLPYLESLQRYTICCGKTVCGGCNYQHQAKCPDTSTCPFCRTPIPDSDETMLAQLQKKAKRKDANALRNLALGYGHGDFGLPTDQAQCIALYRESAGLGFPSAQHTLGVYLATGRMGLEQNMEEALKCFKEAAEGGNLISRFNLGNTEGRNGNHDCAMSHWRLSASGGHRLSMEALIDYFEDGFLKHGDLAESLKDMYLAKAEMSSKARDMFITHLKETGEYEKDPNIRFF